MAPAPSLGRRLLGVQNRNLWFWIFVGPFLLGLLIFVVVPIGWSIYLSFFSAYNTVTPTEFVGFDNYADLFSDDAFTGSLVTFIVFALFIVPVTFVGSLALALLINRARWAKSFFRSVFFIPVACSYVVAALIWKLSIFSGVNFGLANQVRGAVGLDSIAWLSVTHPPWYWLVIVTVRLWLQLGFYMILFLAGLQRISPSLYEAAAIDGARSGWQTFRHITFPQLRGTSVAVVVLLLVNAFQAFDEFYNLLASQGGYPPYARPPLVYLYYIALGQQQDLGHGSAGAVILAALIAIFAIVQGRVIGFGESSVRDERRSPASGAESGHGVTIARTRRDRTGSVLRYVVLVVGVILFLTPFYLLLRNALATNADITSPDWKFVPSTLRWSNFGELFDNPSVPFVRSLVNSIVVGVTQTLGTLLLCSLAGYGMARIPNRFSNAVFGLLLATLLIPAAVTFVPSFIVVSSLGWLDSYRGLIIPGLFSAVAAFLFRQAFLGFPGELEDAARVDGLGYWGTFWRIVVPNSKPIFAAVGTLTFIASWNQFLWPLIIAQDPDSWTVQLSLSTFITAQTVNLSQLFAAGIISIIPLLLVFVVLQRFIVQGVERTGINA